MYVHSDDTNELNDILRRNICQLVKELHCWLNPTWIAIPASIYVRNHHNREDNCEGERAHWKTLRRHVLAGTILYCILMTGVFLDRAPTFVPAAPWSRFVRLERSIRATVGWLFSGPMWASQNTSNTLVDGLLGWKKLEGLLGRLLLWTNWIANSPPISIKKPWMIQVTRSCNPTRLYNSLVAGPLASPQSTLWTSSPFWVVLGGLRHGLLTSDCPLVINLVHSHEFLLSGTSESVSSYGGFSK